MSGTVTKNKRTPGNTSSPIWPAELQASLDGYGKVFQDADRQHVAHMLRDDWRRHGPRGSRTPRTRGAGRREKSDFLLPTNIAGEVLDFQGAPAYVRGLAGS